MRNQTSVLSMIRMDMLRLKRGNTLKIGVILELLVLVLCGASGECDFKTVRDIWLSQYMGIVLALRYVYVGLVVSQLFSKDINERIFELYFSTSNLRGSFLISKISCVLILQGMCSIVSTVVLSIYCFGACDMQFMLIDMAKMMALNSLPLVVHTFFIMFVDVLFSSSAFTSLLTICMILASGLLPYKVSRWIYMSYANLCAFIEYSDVKMVWIMCLVLGSTTLVSLGLGWIRVQRLELL